jgi:hypothetical protein
MSGGRTATRTRRATSVCASWARGGKEALREAAAGGGGGAAAPSLAARR